jgi:hypothetical protein
MGERALRGGRRAAADQMEAGQHDVVDLTEDDKVEAVCAARSPYPPSMVFSPRPLKRQRGLSLKKAAPTLQTVPGKKQTVAQPEGCATAAPQVESATVWAKAPLGLDLGGETVSVAPCTALRPSLCAAAVCVVRRPSAGALFYVRF